MTKCYEEEVLGLYQHILADMTDRYPSLRKEFSRDYLRLCSAMEHNGLRFFTINLVEIGKHFDQCLAIERYDRLTGLHCRRGKPGTVIPRLFQGLLLRVFHRSGELRVDVDIPAIACLRQLYYAVKKLDMECSDAGTFREVSSFYDVDKSVRGPTLDWGGSGFSSEQANACSLEDYESDLRADELPTNLSQDVGMDTSIGVFLNRLQIISDIYCGDIGVFNPEQWKGRHGPGAVSDLKSGLSKYSFPTWSDRLDSVFKASLFAFANEGLWAEVVAQDPDILENKECPSRLIAVPKTQKGPRLIASEPTSSMWCQQAILSYLVEATSRSCISRSVSFRDQSINANLARDASITQSHWTIDLSSASDRISLHLIERIFRKNKTLLEALWAVRTRTIENSIDKKSPKLYEIRKFTTMGSACTFPVQTILFALIAISATIRGRVSRYSIREAAGQVHVFGDDIIVPAYAGAATIRLLTTLGLKVNTSKTFCTGKFRESCGTDAYAGVDVTPAYFRKVPSRSRPESVVSTVNTSNNFLSKGFCRTANWIHELAERSGQLTLPFVEPGSGMFGIETPWKENIHLRKRWNPLLQRVEALVTIPSGRAPRSDDHWYNRLLQYFTEAPRPDDLWVSGIPVRPRLNLRRRWVEWDPTKMGPTPRGVLS